MHKIHGMYRTKPHNSWRSMRDRLNPKSKDYGRYGGRGIDIDPRWERSFVLFWGDMKDGYVDGYTIDRIDNNKGYYKENCRWASMEMQCNNRRSNTIVTYKGDTSTVARLCRKYGTKPSVVYGRLSSGWSVDNAFDVPVQKNKVGVSNESNWHC